MNTKTKKLFILNIPYLFLALLFTKVSQAWRLAVGYEIGDKILNLTDGFTLASFVHSRASTKNYNSNCWKN